MSLIIAEGFDFYDAYLPGDENSLLDRLGWSTETNNPGTPVSFQAAPNGGRELLLGVGDGVPGRYVLCRQSLPAAEQELCVGGLFYFNVAFSSIRPFDEFIVLIDTVGGEKVTLSLDGSQNLVLTSSLSGQSFIDPATTQHDQYHYYEIVVQSGTATLYYNNASLGSVSVGGTVNFDEVHLRLNLGAPSDRNQFIRVDDFYITNFSGAEFVGHLGPIGIVPLIPTADGAVGTDMTPVPASPSDKYLKVDDHAGGNPTDKDATHVVGSGDGTIQTFTCTAERSFTGNALGFMLSASCKSGVATNDTLDLLVNKGAQEAVQGGFSVPVAAWHLRITDVFTALPDGSAMSQANLEAAEFGVRLIRP